MARRNTKSYGPVLDPGPALKRGFDKLAHLLSVTLGPTQGNVLSYQLIDEKKLEVLTDSATIARRVMQLPHRAEDVGAMLMRNLVWRMHKRVGDGCATTAVLAQAILEQAYRYKTAGANPMLLQQGLKVGARAALAALEAMAEPVEDEEDLAALAETITTEPDLSLIIGEMFDILGPEAHITIQDYVAPYLEREYLEGGRWVGRMASPYFITDNAARRAIIADCQVALYAGRVTTLEEVQPLLELIASQEKQETQKPQKTQNPPKLALFVHEIKDVALSTLLANHQQKKIRTLVVELRRPVTPRRTDFEDLAVLTGATLLAAETGQSLSAITAADLGTARRIEADADEAIVVGDERHAQAVRAQIETLQARFQDLPEDDEGREELRLRLARLSGHVGTLKIGAYTKPARALLRQKAEKALRALPSALREGVVPGGGLAYLNCIPAVCQAQRDTAGEVAWGVEVLARALEAPFYHLLRNVGVEAPAAVLAGARRHGPTFGYDALTRQIVDMKAAGLVDSAGILRVALETAVSGAAMALTTDTLVLHRRPQKSSEP